MYRSGVLPQNEQKKMKTRLKDSSEEENVPADKSITFEFEGS